MFKPLRQHHSLLKMVNYTLIDFAALSSLSYWWNFVSLLGLCLIVQIVTGLFLSSHYNADIINSINTVNNFCRYVNYGRVFWIIHANGALLLFICVYMHVYIMVSTNIMKHGQLE